MCAVKKLEARPSLMSREEANKIDIKNKVFTEQELKEMDQPP